MKTSKLGMLIGMLLSTVFATSGAFAQSFGHVARNACGIAQDAKKLSDVIEASMHDSIFENRLHHDAAEIFRTAERIESVAERNGNVRQMEGDAKLLSIIIERMERTLTEAETFAIRNPHHPGVRHCRTHLVQNQVEHICHDVSNLQRDIEVLCRMSSRPHVETRSYQPERYQTERYETYRPYTYENQAYQSRSNQIPGVNFGNGRFTIQFGR